MPNQIYNENKRKYVCEGILLRKIKDYKHITCIYIVKEREEKRIQVKENLPVCLQPHPSGACEA